MTPSQQNDIPSPLAAISLKLVGAATILVAMIDFILLLFPPQLSEPAWLVGTMGSIVERGIVPLVGIALLIAGYWVDTSIGKSSRKASLVVDARFWTCLLSSLLGLIFILIMFLYPLNANRQLNTELALIENQSELATEELQGRLNEQLAQSKTQIDALLADESQFQAAVASGELDAAQIEQFERFRSDPQELDSFLSSQVGELETNLQNRISEEKQVATDRVKANPTLTVKAMTRVVLSSLLMGFVYAFIGWAGLRRLLAMVS